MKFGNIEYLISHIFFSSGVGNLRWLPDNKMGSLLLTSTNVSCRFTVEDTFAN